MPEEGLSGGFFLQIYLPTILRYRHIIIREREAGRQRGTKLVFYLNVSAGADSCVSDMAKTERLI